MPPEIFQQAVAPALRRGGTAQTVEVGSLFRDPDVVGTAVRVSFRIGATVKTMDVELFDATKPISVANFLAYVDGGRYANNFMHRSVAGFIVQGGGFRWTATNGVESVPTFATIQNEPGISNLRGTIAMAKLGGDPDSASSQWFVNLADNSANLDAQNGGFTVFARVIGSGMDVADEIAALPKVNAGGAFTDLPVKDYTTGDLNRVHTIETNAARVATLTFTTTSDDAGLVAAALTGTTLRLTPAADRFGSTMVHVTATDLEGGTATMDLPVTVARKSEGWHTGAVVGDELTLVFDPGDTAALVNDNVPVDWGSVFVGEPTGRPFVIRNDSGAPLSGVTVSSSNPEFLIALGAGPVDIPAGGSVEFQANLTATGTGPRNGILRIRTADANAPSLDLAASGTASEIPPPVVAGVTAQTLFAAGTGSATMPDLRGSVVTATDPRGVTAFTQTPAPGVVLALGSYPLTFSATNAANKTTTLQTTVTVRFEIDTLRVLATAAYTGAALPTGATGFPEGSVLAAFGTPAISDRRELASRITITAGRAKLAAIYVEDAAGQGRIVAQQGATFKSFLDPLLSASGKVAFGAKLTGAPGGADEGVWTDLFGPLAPILREGMPVPGLASLKLKSVLSASITDDALLALIKLAPARDFVTPASDTALIRITSATTGRLLARTGAGLLGSSVSKISVLQPATTSAGQGRWHGASDTLVKVTLADKRTVLVKVNSLGVQTPLLQTNATYAALGIPAYGGPSVALLAQRTKQPGITTANDTALLFAANGSTFTTILSEQAGFSNFASFADPVANAAGKVLFFGTRRGAVAQAPDIKALWRNNGVDAPEPIATLGSSALDADGEAIPDAVWSKFTTFALPDQAGPIFTAELKGKSVTGKTKLGLWAADFFGTLHLILRTGDDITLPTGTKQLKAFTLLNALPGSYGARRSYNTTGSFAVQATFTDLTQALIRVDVP